ncbi:DEAD/DEAH family helicase [Spiroplasma sabaudiense Ar-1343]|uniref:DEAD/DEAH family helicase n=1 Tax=Spiroplasma sabaudiense Ar-1343 TaxID=1276257 RepID=W6AAX4_9MOLU|nr:DEAD/DEAH box helicase family protein [Spiroplasma sabaudiense]AHI54323.1 DEAD/DEAH family helicase [Spiroplasma sabaudiense Ar-1343]
MKKDKLDKETLAYEEILLEGKQEKSNDDINILDNKEDFLISHFNNLVRKKISSLPDYDSKNKIINSMLNLLDYEEFSNKMSYKGQKFEKTLSNNAIYTNKDFFKDFKKEFLTSCEINIIAPFFSRHMINTHLRPFLEDICESKRIKIKILTTTFDGKSIFLDLDGLRNIVNEFNNVDIEVKIENLFKKNSSRIHVKSYIFKRENGFGSAYVGSSNYTTTGMITGNEWNHKTSEFENNYVFKEIVYNFELLWNNPDLVNINNDEEVKEIIENQNFYKNNNKLIFNHEKIIPKNYQQEALNALKNRRDQKLKKHLVVMATGTGKTIVAALDYLNQINENNGIKPKMLFIADKVEIIRQAMNTFRKLINDQGFGVEFSGECEANLETEDYVFATVQKLLNYKEILIKKDFDLVIFDEAHHVKAKSFTEIYNILNRSNQIIGLTATPEREDGTNIKDEYFDGEYAFELRLWDAVSENMLSKFDYYFIKDDSVDISGISLQNTSEISEKLRTNLRNDFVYKNIVKYIDQKVIENSVLIFCVDQKHALSVNSFLKSKGLMSECLISDQKNSRSDTINRFKNKDFNYLCVVNIFNEGIDVPDVNHLIFLRPTQSLTLYIQQFGRGLRWKLDKKLQVLDFVNNVDMKFNKNYSPINILNAFLNKNNRLTFEHSLDNLNDLLPEGSNVFLDTKVQKEVMEAIKNAVQNRKNIFKNLSSSDISNNFISYKNFFLETGLSLSDVYYKGNNNGLKSFLFEENRAKFKSTSIMKQFLWINNYELISKFISIINSSILSGDKLIDNIFVHSFFYNYSSLSKINEEFGTTDFNEIIFSKENQYLVREILFLLKYKLKYENLISSKKINSELKFVGTYFTKRQSLALAGISNLNEFSIQLIQGVFKNKNRNKFIIWASDPSGKEKYDFQNFYDKSKNTMGWPSPDDWSEKNKTCQEFLSSETIFVFYKDSLLKKNFNDEVFEFKGRVLSKKISPNTNKGLYFKIEVDSCV